MFITFSILKNAIHLSIPSFQPVDGCVYALFTTSNKLQSGGQTFFYGLELRPTNDMAHLTSQRYKKCKALKYSSRNYFFAPNVF